MTQISTESDKRASRRAVWRNGAKVAWSYLLITVGACLVALAADLFMVPNKLVSGGAVGIATILYYTLGTPVGIVTLAINVPLLIAAAIWLGGLGALLRTIWGVAVLSVAIDLFAPYVSSPTSDPILYMLYGGLMDGLGLGLVFLAGGTTGGTDIIAQLARRWFGIKLGHTLLATNIIILGTSSLIFGVEPVLYAIIVSYVSTRVVDLVQEGSARIRSALIITQKPDDIKREFYAQLDRSMTVLRGEGGYSGQSRTVLLCAVSQSEISKVKRIVSEQDADAFVILFAASEVLGAGFQGLGKRP